jgi:HlyD family secretion protein
MEQISHQTSVKSLRRHMLVGISALVILVGGFGGWMAVAEFSGAVVGAGTIVVDSYVKKIQHPVGGVVGEILVKEGDRVAEQQVLMRLDENVIRANLAVVSKVLDETAARQARLEAEREQRDEITFPEDLLARSAADKELNSLLETERRIFSLRRFARAGQQAQLQERIGQLNEEVNGATAQLASVESQTKIMETELASVRDLYKKNLVPISRVSALEREAARLQGQSGALIASRAQAKGRITETQMQILQIDQDLRSEVATDLREAQVKISEYVERRVAAQDQLSRTEIRAPQAGTVHQLAVHTVGGVITAGETIMQLVPESDVLAIDMKVAPQEIDQLYVGQPATVKVLAFNHATTPELNAVVSLVSADISVDQRTGVSTYLLRLAIPPSEVAKLGDLRLMPGMPVEAYIRTNDRTVLSYLVKPLTDQMNRAMRER